MEKCHEAWYRRVALPEIYEERGTTIDDTAKRGITNQQLNQASDFVNWVLTDVEIVETSEFSPLRGKSLTPDNVSMYSVHDYFVFPLTLPHRCSFVDLVSTAKAQPPKWFVSHAWSTPFSQTVSMLRLHMQSRDLPPTTPYWICTFANNQHDLGELGGDVLQAPFARAILLPDCVGTLLLVDANCTPMTRAWCVLESWVATIKATGKRFDVAAMIPEGEQKLSNGIFIEPGPALRMDLGNGAHKDVVGPENGWFPGTVATEGVAVKATRSARRCCGPRARRTCAEQTRRRKKNRPC